MSSEINNIQNRIEHHITNFKKDNHYLLYEYTMKELDKISVKKIDIQLKNLKLFRIRIHAKNEVNETRDLLYAPQKNITRFGRVNRPGQSMLYCAEQFQICEKELIHDYLLNNEIGYNAFATYTKWEIMQPLNLFVLSIAKSKCEYVNGFNIHDLYLNSLKLNSNDLQQPLKNFYALTNYFFHKNAKNDTAVYIVCSAIANYVTLCFPYIDGFVYSSVQGILGYNIVLRPHVIDQKKVELTKTVISETWHVEKENTVKIDSSLKKTGDVENEKINWNASTYNKIYLPHFL